MKLRVRLSRPLVVLLALSAAWAGMVYAQLEGGERGVQPIDSTSSYEVSGIKVDVLGKTAEQARLEGWKQAQVRGWKSLWASVNGRPATEAPNLPASTIDSIVSAIEVEREEIGPTRYIATLGVLFDRARTGPLLGGTLGEVRRSAPMLIVPVMMTASTSHSFEFRTEWQKAWARFRTGNSSIDYVRPVGNGIDPLLLNASQANRPGRGWWRMILDQYGASDILSPQVQLARSFPGGPVTATFWARHGPDNRLLGIVQLRVGRSDRIPQLLDEGVKRVDAIYARALQEGRLTRDPSLTAEEPEIPTDLAELIERATTQAQQTETAPTEQPTGPILSAPAQSFTIRVDTPTAASVTQSEVSLGGVSGVSSALTTSIAVGGTSVMRVTYAGDLVALQAALQAQGWTVQASGGSLRISRGGAPAGQ